MRHPLEGTVDKTQGKAQKKNESEGEEEEGIHCFLSAGNRWENDVIRQKANKENWNSGKKTKQIEKREKELNSTGWSLQVPPSNLHPTSMQQGTESPPLCASFFPAPRRGDLLSRRQMALPLPVLLWGLFPDGELEASLCCSSLPVHSPRVLRAPPACVPGSSAAQRTLQLNPLGK